MSDRLDQIGTGGWFGMTQDRFHSISTDGWFDAVATLAVGYLTYTAVTLKPSLESENTWVDASLTTDDTNIEPGT